MVRAGGVSHTEGGAPAKRIRYAMEGATVQPREPKQLRMAATPPPPPSAGPKAFRMAPATRPPASERGGQVPSGVASKSGKRVLESSTTSASAASVVQRRARVQQRRRLDPDNIVIPGRTSLELMSVGPNTRKAYARLLLQLAAWTMGLTPNPLDVPVDLQWEAAIQTILSLGQDAEELDDATASFTNACFWKGEHSSIGNRLNSAISWALPQFSR